MSLLGRPRRWCSRGSLVENGEVDEAVSGEDEQDDEEDEDEDEEPLDEAGQAAWAAAVSEAGTEGTAAFPACEPVIRILTLPVVSSVWRGRARGLCHTRQVNAFWAHSDNCPANLRNRSTPSTRSNNLQDLQDSLGALSGRPGGGDQWCAGAQPPTACTGHSACTASRCSTIQ